MSVLAVADCVGEECAHRWEAFLGADAELAQQVEGVGAFAGGAELEAQRGHVELVAIVGGVKLCSFRPVVFGLDGIAPVEGEQSGEVVERRGVVIGVGDLLQDAVGGWIVAGTDGGSRPAEGIFQVVRDELCEPGAPLERLRRVQGLARFCHHPDGLGIVPIEDKGVPRINHRAPVIAFRKIGRCPRKVLFLAPAVIRLACGRCGKPQGTSDRGDDQRVTPQALRLRALFRLLRRVPAFECLKRDVVHEVHPLAVAFFAAVIERHAAGVRLELLSAVRALLEVVRVGAGYRDGLFGDAVEFVRKPLDQPRAPRAAGVAVFDLAGCFVAELEANPAIRTDPPAGSQGARGNVKRIGHRSLE